MRRLQSLAGFFVQPHDRRADAIAPHLSGLVDHSVIADVRTGLAGSVDRGRLTAHVVEALSVRGRVLGPRALARAVEEVGNEVFGAGPLQPYLDDPEVCDVLVNGPQEVWVERAGALIRVPVDLRTPGDVRALAVRLAGVAGRRLDDASPAVDARLPDGTRFHALLPPLAGPCTVISLRVPRSQPYRIEELVKVGTLAPVVAVVLTRLMGARANLLVSGSTGTGKTTLLAALLTRVDPGQRIVVVEESPELEIGHPHVVHLSTRLANVEGAGGVGLSDLVRHALRMRPDRIVLGECRGSEIRDVLTALNTGHEGGCVTMHANAAEDVPARLEALGALAGMGRDAVAAQALSAVDAVVHLRRSGGRRYVAQVATLGRVDRGLQVEVALGVSPDGRVLKGPGWPELQSRIGSDDPFSEVGHRSAGILQLRPRRAVGI